MGYRIGGQCFADTSQALAQWSAAFPAVQNGTVVSEAAPSTISDAGVLTWSLSNQSMVDGAAVIRNGTTQLTACADTDLNGFDVAFAGQVFALPFTTVIAFWFLSRVAKGVMFSMGIDLSTIFRS